MSSIFKHLGNRFVNSLEQFLGATDVTYCADTASTQHAPADSHTHNTQEAESDNEEAIQRESALLNSPKQPRQSHDMSSEDYAHLIRTNQKPPSDARPVTVRRPGANKPPDYSIGSINTLNQTRRTTNQTPRKQVGYGKPTGPRFSGNALEFASSRGDNVRKNGGHDFPDYSPGRNKRRKVDHKPSSPLEVIDLSDDDTAQKPIASRSVERITNRPTQLSRKSSTSEKRKQSLDQSFVSGSQELNLFNNLITSHKNGYKGYQRQEPEVRPLLPPFPYSNMKSPHVLSTLEKRLDDEASKSQTPRQTPDNTTSKYFAQKSSPLDVDELAHSGGSPRPKKRGPSPAVPAKSLANTFVRDDQVEQQPALKKQRIEQIDDSIDELQELPIEPLSAGLPPTAQQKLKEHRARRKSNAMQTKLSAGAGRSTNGLHASGADTAQLDNIKDPKTLLSDHHIAVFNGLGWEKISSRLTLAYRAETNRWLLQQNGDLFYPKSSDRTTPLGIDVNDIVDVVRYVNNEPKLKFTMAQMTGSNDSILIGFQSDADSVNFLKQWRRYLEAESAYSKQMKARREADNAAAGSVDHGQEVDYLQNRTNQRKKTIGSVKASLKTEATNPSRGGRLVDNLQDEDGNVARLSDPPPPKRPARPRQENATITETLSAPRATRTSSRTAAVNATNKIKAISPVVESPALSRYSRDVGLGEPWEQAVVYPPVGSSRATVEWDDLFRLDNGEFLNDNLIQFWLRYKQEGSNHFEGEVYVFTSYLYSTLTKGSKRGIDYASVKRWTSKVNIFNYKYLVVPINEDFHWYLAIITHPGKLLDPPEDIVEEVEETIDVKPASNHDDQDDVIAVGEQAISDITKGLLEKVSDLTIEDKVPRTLKAEPSSDSVIAVAQDKEWPDSQENGHTAAKSPFSGKAPGIPLDAENEGDVQVVDAKAGTARVKKGKRKSAPTPRKYDPAKPMIIMLDSFNVAHTNTARNLKEYLVAEAKDKCNREILIENINAMNTKDIPLQNNFSDCGVYLLGYAEKFLEDRDAFITYVLTRSFPDGYWVQLDPVVMRELMRRTIQDMEKEQKEKRVAEKKAKKEIKRLQKAGQSTTGKTSSPEKSLPGTAVPSKEQSKEPSPGKQQANPVMQTPSVSKTQNEPPFTNKTPPKETPSKAKDGLIFTQKMQTPVKKSAPTSTEKNTTPIFPDMQPMVEVDKAKEPSPAKHTLSNRKQLSPPTTQPTTHQHRQPVEEAEIPWVESQESEMLFDKEAIIQERTEIPDSQPEVNQSTITLGSPYSLPAAEAEKQEQERKQRRKNEERKDHDFLDKTEIPQSKEGSQFIDTEEIPWQSSPKRGKSIN